MPNALALTYRYVVSADGRVHQSDCPIKGRRTHPWPEFDGKRPVEVLGIITAQAGGLACDRCVHDAPDGSEQLGFGHLDEADPALPEQLKEQGIAVANANAKQDWVRAADQAIDQLAATGQPFTADDVRALGIPDPESPKAWGARFNTAARTGRIRRVGYVPSRRPSVHAHPIAQWVGAAA